MILFLGIQKRKTQIEESHVGFDLSIDIQAHEKDKENKK